MPVRWPGGGLNLFGRWYEGAAMPTGRSQLVAVVLGGWVYCIGGFNGVQYLSTVEVYDPSSDTWVTRAPMPTPRAAAQASVLGGKIHVVGGYNGTSGPLTAHEVYDPATDSWTTAQPLPEPILHGGLVTLRNQLLLAGGFTGNFIRSTLRRWQLDSTQWVALAPMPQPRYQAGVATVSGHMYVVGGRAEQVLDRVDRYDPINDTWTTEPALPGAREDVKAVGFHHYLHVLGGSGYDTFHQAYHTVRRRWERRAPLPLGRDHFAAVRWADRIIVIGGYNTGKYLGRVDIWWPLGA